MSPWNTDPTEVELFARIAIPQGEVSFLSNRKFGFVLMDIIRWFLKGKEPRADLTSYRNSVLIS